MQTLRRTLIALPLLLAALGAHAAAAVGQIAPDFTLQSTEGKYVVLEWTNPGCPFVRKHYDSGNMPATQKAARAQGLAWLSVNSTAKESGDYLEPARLAAWLAERKARPTAILMDEEGTVGHAYGARTTPHMYIVNPQGQLIYAGGIDSIPSSSADDVKKAVNYVKQGVTQALAGQALSNPTTRPYGCSIKYKSGA